MLKFPVDGGIVTIRSTILIPAECPTVITSSKEIPKEAENIDSISGKDIHPFDRRKGARPRSVRKPSKRRIVTPFQKSTGKLNLSAATPLSVSWTRTKAITRYRWQRQMKRKRLSTPAKGQVSRNIEVYVDDLVIKSHTEAEMLRDIDETFRFMISPEGIKSCPDKTKVVLQLSSPRTIKEVKSLNGKLASLNRFLSKSVEKSLPLFKTLKKFIKKSDFHWTPKAEQAFKQLKQHLSELPLLVAPKPKKELIVYLSASHGAISAVLMTERGTAQTPVYFVSHALQGPELNYTPMEKLVLSLVFAAKRLRRYFQAHPIAVITDQPIKQIMSRPDVAGRLQKWSVMLGEHNITYRPRTSVKGQILADFLVEKPDESPPDTSVVETP
ncbi:reverse transcriptase domain-containing protein [Tanacetum coccineum]